MCEDNWRHFLVAGEQKFPAFSMHIAPSLQPQQMFTGPSALKDLAKSVADLPANAPLAPVSHSKKVIACFESLRTT